MEVLILPSAEDCGRLVAEVLAAAVTARAPGSGLTLGLATGSSPLLAYRELIRRHREEGLSFAGVRAVLLDEYVGLPADHPETYRSVIRRELTDHLDIDDVLGPDGTHPDPLVAAADYEQVIADAGPVAVQLLGIGANGHIGFNEPGASFASRTRVVRLAESTRKVNATDFEDDRSPECAISVGMATISEARKVLLLASGENKARAVAAALEGEVSEEVPASALRNHPDAQFLMDRDAASALGRTTA